MVVGEHKVNNIWKQKKQDKAFQNVLSNIENIEKNKESIHKNIEKFKKMAKNTISKDKAKNKQKEQSL